MCRLYTHTKRCPSCTKVLYQETIVYDACEISCSCGSCAAVENTENRHSLKDERSESLSHTIACPQAQLLHGTPLWAGRPCGFCRWQRLQEVKRQWHGVHFLELNAHSTNDHDTKSKATVVEASADNGGQETPSKFSPTTEDSKGILKGSTQRRKKSVRFEEPPKVEKKRSSFILRFTRERARNN